MGMDVYGKAPIGEDGGYFRRNVWGWRPLADFCLQFCPEETAGCEHWHSNDGDGLDAAGAAALAIKLNALVEDGTAQAYVAMRDAEIARLPNLDCEFCDGTGVRTDGVGQKMRQPERMICAEDGFERDHPRFGEKGWCNGCNGRGWVRPMACNYGLDVEDIIEFAGFLEQCGGFEIC